MSLRHSRWCVLFFFVACSERSQDVLVDRTTASTTRQALSASAIASKHRARDQGSFGSRRRPWARGHFDSELKSAGVEEPAWRVVGDEPDSIARSGSRLKATFFRLPKGPKLFAAFEDRQLEMKCEFAEGEDGQLRCLPVFAHWPEYLDPTCSDRQVISPWANEAPPSAGDWTSVFSVNAFGETTATSPFRVTGQVTADVAYVKFGDDCFEWSGPNTYYTVERAAVSGFVTGRARRASLGGSRIFADVIAGNDGSRTDALGYYDLALGTEVLPMPAHDRSQNDKDLLWVPADPDPRQMRNTGTFADTRCSVPLVEPFSSAPPHRYSVIPWTPRLQPSCDSYSIPYRTLGRDPVTKTYSGTPRLCSLDEEVPEFPYYAVGREARTERYVEGHLRLFGRGRLAVKGVVSDDGSVAVDSPLRGGRNPIYDRVLDTSCGHGAIPDGVTVCLPFSESKGGPVEDASWYGYSDVSCTTPVIVAEGLPAEPCYRGKVHAYAFDYSDFYHVTRYAGTQRVSPDPIPVYYGSRVDGSCLPETPAYAYAIDSTTTLDTAVFDAPN